MPSGIRQTLRSFKDVVPKIQDVYATSLNKILTFLQQIETTQRMKSPLSVGLFLSVGKSFCCPKVQVFSLSEKLV